MKKNKYYLYIIGGIITIVSVWLIMTYNLLVKKEELVKLQWSEVQNAYQRRLDMVPNLVSIVKGGAEYEKSVLLKVTEARAKAASLYIGNALSADKFNEQTGVQNELAGAANNLMITIENYPTLKGTKAFVGLQAQLEGTERRIKVARKDFNEAVANYNSLVKSFPTRIIAGVLGFRSMEGFQSNSEAGNPIEINFK